MQAQHFQIKGTAAGLILLTLKVSLGCQEDYSRDCPLQDSFLSSWLVPCSDRRRERSTLAAMQVWAGRYPSSRRPPHLHPEKRHPSQANRIGDFVLHLREGHRVSQLSGLVLGLSLYSYRVRELAACWLFFLVLFVVLALLILGVVLAWYAWIYASHWARTTTPVAPVLALASAQVPLETIAGASELK